LNTHYLAILTRGISREAPRRVLLRALSGIGLVSLSTVLVRKGDAHAKKRKRKKCKGGKKKCGKKCFDLQSDAGNCGACGIACESETCIDGACFCPVERDVACGPSCVDLATDSANCGACGNDCPSGSCVNGACTCAGGADCPDACICSAREEGGNACRGSVAPDACDADDDCPLGTYCLKSNLRCTLPCLG
jgi:hypothetical protein